MSHDIWNCRTIYTFFLDTLKRHKNNYTRQIINALAQIWRRKRNVHLNWMRTHTRTHVCDNKHYFKNVQHFTEKNVKLGMHPNYWWVKYEKLYQSHKIDWINKLNKLILNSIKLNRSLLLVAICQNFVRVHTWCFI